MKQRSVKYIITLVRDTSGTEPEKAAFHPKYSLSLSCFAYFRWSSANAMQGKEDYGFLGGESY
jgi:hypothetical protein